MMLNKVMLLRSTIVNVPQLLNPHQFVCQAFVDCNPGYLKKLLIYHGMEVYNNFPGGTCMYATLKT